MDNACDKCYESRQPHTTKCPNCGNNTYVGQIIGMSCVWECSSCGEGVMSAGGFPPACYSNNLYEIFIEKPTDNGSMVKLARILNRSVLKLNSDFSESSVIKLSMKVLDCVKTYKAIIEIGVSCKMDPLLLQNYSRVLNCGYIEQ